MPQCERFLKCISCLEVSLPLSFVAPLSHFADMSQYTCFSWTPQETYARDLVHFTSLLGFTPHDSAIAATFGMATLFMRSNEMTRTKPGYHANCILVDGDRLEDISVLQGHSRLDVLLIKGRTCS
jgi:hypothetical protein